MIAWAAYSIIVAALLTIAAEAVQRVLTWRGRATRFAWTGALFGTVVLPVVLPLLRRGSPQTSDPTFLPPTFSIALDLPPLAVSDAPVLSLREALLASWLTVSVLLLLWGGISLVRLARARHSWRRELVDSTAVFVSDNTGPAVVGFVRPAVVVPSWIRSLPPTQRCLIIAHEREHIAARDPLLLLFARMMPAILPWNPAVWLQARRLREAIELDCDRRLLGGGASANHYAALLLDVGLRGSRSVLAAVTLSEPRSLLERRIRRMLEPRHRRAGLHAGVYALLGAAALLLAAAAPRPDAPLLPTLVLQPAAQQQDPTVPPRLRNIEETKSAIARAFPPLLREAGMAGTTVVSIKVSHVGNVIDARVKAPSGHEALDAAAIRVARQMRFTPGRSRDKAVTAWVDLPIVFATGEAEATIAQRVERAKAEVERRAGQEEERARKAIAEAREARFSDAPILANREEVRSVTERYYPPLLRDAAIGGTVLVRLLIDSTGQVDKAELGESSGHRPLDEAALKVVTLMQFEPARDRGEPVNVWVTVPVTFTPPHATRESASQSRDGLAAGPVFTPFTVAPSLENADDVRKLMQAYYPPLLRNAGIGGTARLWFFIDESGEVVKAQIKATSGHDALDEAALKIAQQMRFAPALNRDQKVKVWVDVPIVFKSQ